MKLKKVLGFKFWVFNNQKPQTKNPKPIKIIIYQCSPCEIAFIKDRTKK